MYRLPSVPEKCLYIIPPQCSAHKKPPFRAAEDTTIAPAPRMIPTATCIKLIEINGINSLESAAKEPDDIQ